MNKKALLFAVLALMISGIIAQNIVLTPNPILVTGSASETQKAIMLVENTTSEDLRMVWLRTLNDKPDSWQISVCDPNLCYAPFADAPLTPEDTLRPWTLKAGDTDSFYVQFEALGVAGVANVEVVIYNRDDSLANHAVGSFSADLTATSVQDLQSDEAQIELFPNPVSDQFNLRIGEVALAELHIFNIVGKKVKQLQLANQGRSTFSVDISDIEEGIYFIRMLNDQGELVATRRISKVR